MSAIFERTMDGALVILTINRKVLAGAVDPKLFKKEACSAVEICTEGYTVLIDLSKVEKIDVRFLEVLKVLQDQADRNSANFALRVVNANVVDAIKRFDELATIQIIEEVTRLVATK